MAERTTPLSMDQIGTGSVRFPSGKPMVSTSDTSVNPYAFSQISKDIHVEGVMFWPQTKEKYPGLVLLHDNWGLTEQIKNYGQRLAAEGYVVIIPNLYGRQGGMITANQEVAEALMERIVVKDLLTDINSCCEYLNTQDHVKQNVHGVLGFGMGAPLAIQFACQRRRLKGAVAYYGKINFPQEVFQSLFCPLLFFQAGKDEVVPKEDIAKLESWGKEFDKKVTIKNLEQASHEFANDMRTNTFDPQASAEAWDAHVEFFSTCFKGL